MPVASRDEHIRYDAVEWAGTTICYRWCHSRRKTLGITVRPDKTVSVRVPLRTPVKDVKAFVKSRAEWVVKVWRKLGAASNLQVQGYCRGAVFMLLGKAYRLEFTKGLHRSLALHDDLLILTTPEIPEEDAVRRMIDCWYLAQAREIAMERLHAFHATMHPEGVPVPPITIRPMKSRWGSYSYRTRRITLNLNLIMMPPACLDYVVIHELCHITIRHHGPEFWQAVSRYFPEFMVVRKQLKQYS